MTKSTRCWCGRASRTTINAELAKHAKRIQFFAGLAGFAFLPVGRHAGTTINAELAEHAEQTDLCGFSVFRVVRRPVEPHAGTTINPELAEHAEQTNLCGF